MTSSSPIIYFIRHGEKPPPDSNGDEVNGLSATGSLRANALPQVFGKDSSYNIGCIIAEHPKKDGSRSRPFETVAPLALTLNIKINSDIERDHVSEAADAAIAYQGPGNVLLCWEHGELAKIAVAMGVTGFAAGVNSGTKDQGEVKYPGDRFDLIWRVEAPYTEIGWVGSEGVLGLDDVTIKK